MSYSIRKRGRRAFTIVEMAFVLGIIAVLLMAYIRFIKSAKEDYNRYTEIKRMNDFRIAVKSAFSKITDSVSEICAEGFSDPSCLNTSPFPEKIVENGMTKLFYRLNISGMSAVDPGAADDLVASLRGMFEGGLCSPDNPRNDGVSFVCPWMEEVVTIDPTTKTEDRSFYDTTNGIDPLRPPEIRVTYIRRYLSGKRKDVDYIVGLAEIYETKRMISVRHFNAIENALKRFHEAKLTAEVLNPPPDGLNSNDDATIPWFWRAISPNPNGVCDRNGGPNREVCWNFVNDTNMWTNNPPNTMSQMIERLSANLNIERSLFRDGFGNGIRMVVLPQLCGNTDMDACGVTNGVPTVAEADYVLNANVRPPYTVVLYVRGYSDLNSFAPDYARRTIIF